MPENTSAVTASGLGFSAEIELLERRAAQLDRATIQALHQESGLPAVSDFGLYQSLAYAKLRLTASQYQEFSIRWEKVLQQAAMPKLLIELDAPAEMLFEQIEMPENWSVHSLEALRAAMKVATTQHSQGPILQLDATCPNSVLTETLAAIEAMEA